MTVKELLERTDSHELAEWMAYNKLEPFGEERADIRAAMIAHTMACMWSKSPPDFEEFMLFREKQPQTFDEMKRTLASAKQRALPLVEK